MFGGSKSRIGAGLVADKTIGTEERDGVLRSSFGYVFIGGVDGSVGSGKDSTIMHKISLFVQVRVDEVDEFLKVVVK